VCVFARKWSSEEADKGAEQEEDEPRRSHVRHRLSERIPTVKGRPHSNPLSLICRDLSLPSRSLSMVTSCSCLKSERERERERERKSKVIVRFEPHPSAPQNFGSLPHDPPHNSKSAANQTKETKPLLLVLQSNQGDDLRIENEQTSRIGSRSRCFQVTGNLVVLLLKPLLSS
jgi:hypothetical protein